MTSKPVVFIAFLEQDNLGIGYISSLLLKEDFSIKIIDFRLGKEAILKQVEQYDPVIVGFSIIFQYHIEDFKELIAYLRDHGIRCHFCAGGHYPSLRFKEVLHYIPQLDSIVLFEGEHTFLELVRSIYSGSDWRQLHGITHHDNGRNVVNPLRPLEDDLDRFPPPLRQSLKEYALGKKFTTILAGRGCIYNCSFCSIREFYSRPPGMIKRLRRPEMVVREMELLHEEQNGSVFMFQDDDFPVVQKSGKDWVTEFCRRLAEKGLRDRILWKISCRPDEVDAETMSLMKAHGLFLVYLGLESGSNDGLRLMNKHVKVETNIRAVNILKQAGLLFDYGFMLFDPDSTYQSIHENLDFLELICGDGSSPVCFSKMLPYAETKIEYELKKAGRLKGKPGFQDYDFLDISIDDLYTFMVNCYAEWVGNRDGLLNTIRWARYYSSVYEKYFPAASSYHGLRKNVRETFSSSNQFFLITTRRLVSIFASSGRKSDQDELQMIWNNVAEKHGEYLQTVNNYISEIELLAKKYQ